MISKLPFAQPLGWALAAVTIALGSVGVAQENPAGRAIKKMSVQAIDANPNLEYNPYTVLVKYRMGTSEADRSSVRAMIGGLWLDKVPTVPGLEIVATQIEPREAAAALSRLPWVEYAEVDYIVRADVIPNDTSFGTLWGMHNTGQSGGVSDADIDGPEAWDIATGSSEMVVAVIDTGIQRTHPDLAANTWVNPNEIPANGIDDDNNGRIDDLYGWDFVNLDNDPMDDNNHGTHCAGTIGGVGNNATGVTGVAWNVKLAALKFLSNQGSGSTANAVLAVDYCRRTGIKLSSNSWGGGSFSQALYDAINNAGAQGHLFVAAAGNSNVNTDSSPHYPSSYALNNVISVASIDRLDAKSSFSNYGAVSVDLGAPGSSILSTIPTNSYSTFSGTSMACPHVSGVAALLWGYRPDMTWQQIRSALFTTVRPTAAMTGRTVTGGVVNAYNALLAAQPTNKPPTVTISSPANGSSFQFGASVTFTGTATDTQDGNLSVGLVWTSNLSGQIGTGASFSTSTLSVGSHTVTAAVTDSGGLTGSATVNLTVTVPPGNTAPTVTILSPANGSSVVQGASVTFTGTANDNEDGNLSANLAWTSSINGAIGSGASFSTSGLSVGNHTVTASVTDVGGLTGSASITIQVNAPSTPAAPSGLVATKTRPGVRLDWTDNSGNEDGFTIERQVRSGKSWGGTVTFDVGANVTTFSQDPGTGQFRYRVRSFNAAGQSAWTSYLNVKL